MSNRLFRVEKITLNRAQIIGVFASTLESFFQICKAHKEDLPEELRSLIDLINYNRRKIETVLPETIDGPDTDDNSLLRNKYSNMYDLTFHVIENNLDKLPEFVKEFALVILNIREQLEKASARPKGAPRKVEADPRKYAFLKEYFSRTLKSLFGKDIPDSISSFNHEVKIEILYESFHKLAEGLEENMEDLMDDKATRLAAAMALSEVMDIPRNSATSFFAHASRKFREKSPLWAFYAD